MAPLSLRIVQDGGAVTRKMKLDPSMSVAEATRLVNEKANLPPEAKAYGLFLRSMDSNYKGIWMEADKKLSDYVLRDGDQVEYITKIRNLKVRMLDDTVKTFKVDQSKYVGELLLSICAKIGITNHEEYGMCIEECDEADEALKPGSTGTLTARMKSKLEERDLEFEQLSKKLKTDDNVDWIDPHITLSEVGVAPLQTLLLKRKLFYSDRNVDSRDPVQLNLLYNQARDNILHGRHPVTVEKAEQCKGRYMNIRDQFRKKLLRRARNPQNAIRRYKYEQECSYLIPFYRDFGHISSEITQYDNDVSNASNQELEQTEIVDTFLDLDQAFQTQDTRKTDNDTSLFDLNPSDPLDVFLMTVGNTLKNFNPYYLNQAKSKIFQACQDYELKQIVDKQGSSGNG